MSQNILDYVAQSSIKKDVPALEPGQVVRVHQKIKEGEKERTQIFEGLIISLNAGSSADKTFTVRKVVEGVGVEKIFPLYSPIIEKIEVLKKGKVRRAKLYYMRDLSGKSTRLRDEKLGEVVMVAAPKKAAAEAPSVQEESVEEAPAEETPSESASENA